METLAELIYPIEVTLFLKDYWNKEYLLIRNMNDKLKNFFRYNDLSELLNTHSHNLEYPEIRVTLDAEHVHPKEYIDNINFFVNKHSFKNKINPEKLNDLLNRNASIALSDIQDYNLKLQKLAHSLSKEVAEQVNINLYYSRLGKNTFHNHADPDSSFIVQLEGQKKWTIFEEPKDTVEGLNNLQVLSEFIMNQGDVLYLPSGVWHNALSVGTSSLSINVTLTSLKIIELLLEIIETKVLPSLDVTSLFGKFVPTKLNSTAKEYNSELKLILMHFKKIVNDSLETVSINDVAHIITELKENKKNSRGLNTHDFPFKFGIEQSDNNK